MILMTQCFPTTSLPTLCRMDDILYNTGFPGSSVVKNSPANAGDRFDPWVAKIPWRRKGQTTPVFLPGKSHEEGSLVGYSPWGCKIVRHDFTTKQQHPL